MKALGILALFLVAGPKPGSATTGSVATPPGAATTAPGRPTATPSRPATARGGQPGVPPPPTQVEADSIEYIYKEHRTVMIGKPLVTFRREDAVLVCRKMVADHDQSGDVQKAVCEGDVKLTRGEKIVTCNRATFTADDNRIVCRGDPVLHDGPSIMYCDEATYDLEEDRVFLKQGKGTIFQKPGQALTKKKDREKGKAP